jgi:prepilin-type N-terminal cleavage/methylation domain-containing protein
MNKYQKIRKEEKGYTLLELVVVVVITGIISVVIGSLVGQQARNFTSIFSSSDLLDDGRNTINLLRRDLRNSSNDSINTMTYDLLNFTDSDGNIVEYEFAANILYRNSTVIAENLQADPFIYFDASKSEVYVPANVSLIQVTLDFKKKSESIKLEEFIYVRN